MYTYTHTHYTERAQHLYILLKQKYISCFLIKIHFGNTEGEGLSHRFR